MDFNLDRDWETHLMDDPPERHHEAAEHHDSSAARHDAAARFWEKQGDAERATLQRDMAAWERGAADLERRWAAIAGREAR